jgi:hypothetical protein
MTSECQATLCALLSFLFRFCRHLFALSSVLMHCTQSEARRKARDLGPFACYCLLFSNGLAVLNDAASLQAADCFPAKGSSASVALPLDRAIAHLLALANQLGMTAADLHKEIDQRIKIIAEPFPSRRAK